jgi:uncharacterized protein YdgA (DUF945 family)
MTTEPTRTNGAELDDRQKRALDFTFAEHLVVKGELEDARREIGELRMVISQDAVEKEALRSFNNLLESRVAGCVADRDAKVERWAKNEAVLEAVMAILRKHEVSAVPLVREKGDPQ